MLKKFINSVICTQSEKHFIGWSKCFSLRPAGEKTKIIYSHLYVNVELLDDVPVINLLFNLSPSNS